MSVAPVSVDVRKEIAAIVGEGNVNAPAPEMTIDGVEPQVVASPADSEQVVAILAFASRNDLVVVPYGGGSQQAAGFTPERVDIVLSTVYMNKILHYDAGDLTLSVGTGMKVAEVQKMLAEHGQFLPIDPPDPEHATIGGTLAANVMGPAQAGYGSVRDFCIGIEFVTGDGVIAKGGGRVVKNVAGYDMMKLMIGSYGTLGVITSANFKVFPKPKQLRTYVLRFPTVEKLTAFLASVARSPLSPVALEVVSPLGMEYVTGPERPRDPDDYAPISTVHINVEWHVYVRVAGSDAVQARYRKELGTDVGQGGIVQELGGDDDAAIWSGLCDWPMKVAERHPHGMNIKLTFPIAEAGAVLEKAQACATMHNLLFAAAGRPSAGVMMGYFLPFTTDPAASMQFAGSISSLRAELPKGCAVTVLRCPQEAKARFDVWGVPRADIEVMREVRKALDPQGILNRGRFLI